jgi:hypothetical protein
MVAELTSFENRPRALAPRLRSHRRAWTSQAILAALVGAAAVTAELSQIEQAIERKPTASPPRCEPASHIRGDRCVDALDLRGGTSRARDSVI